MSERAAPIDEATMKFGLLMESAQTHQKLAETHLERLKAHTQDLDGLVREEIRRTLVEELREISTETARATRALKGMRRAANLRAVLWSVGVAALCTAIPAAIAHWMLPSAAEITALRAERDRLTSNIERLAQQGGRVEWRRCGEQARLCVRVERGAPAYGDKGEFVIVKGS